MNEDNGVFKAALDILLFANVNADNRIMLRQYFQKAFGSSPFRFSNFLTYLRKELDTSSDVALRQKIAKRYLSILSPLCSRFGFHQEALVLNDLAFKIAYPEKFEEVNGLLKIYQETARDVVEKGEKILSDLLDKHGYEYTLKGRYKTIYSLYSKMRRRGMSQDLTRFSDIFAFRVILKGDQENQCFEILNLLHDSFYPISDEFKDYITIPKLNGYQSLHTSLTNLVDNLDIPIEIQIRTEIMDEVAEKGVAAHWIYSESKTEGVTSNRKRKLLQKHFLSMIDSDEAEFVYCFSPKGDLVKLDFGASVKEFARRIHSDLEIKAKAALVNGREKNVKYQIQDGDCVQVLT